MIAWVVGASGTWGDAVARDLLERGYDLVALGRTEPEWQAAFAAARHHTARFVALDLEAPDEPRAAALAAELGAGVPDVLIVCSAATGCRREVLVRVNYLVPAALVQQVAAAMTQRGSGRIGVFMGQNARLGMPGAGDFSASQGALWTWCEAFAGELARSGSVSLTRVIPPRAASRTQAWIAAQSGHAARTREPKAGSLVAAILAGKRRAGRRPLLAALAMLFR